MLVLSVVAIVASLFAPAAATPQRSTRNTPEARVYVFTAPAAGAETEEDKGRQDAAGDVREALRGKRHLTLVDTREAADVVVEVIGREERDLGEGGFGGKSLTKFRETIVRVRVTSKDRSSDLKGIGKGSWKSAAKDLAARLQKWIERG